MHFSRLTFGTLCGRDVVMVIDIDGSEHAQLKSLLDVASSVIKEQVVHIDRFNVLRYTHTNIFVHSISTCLIDVHAVSHLFCMPLIFITNF